MFEVSEIVVLSINILFILFAYFWFFPRVVKDDINKMAKYDLLSSMGALFVAGVLFYGKEVEFSLFGSLTNWFWFSIVSYFILEIPFALWYMRRYLRD